MLLVPRIAAAGIRVQNIQNKKLLGILSRQHKKTMFATISPNVWPILVDIFINSRAIDLLFGAHSAISSQEVIMKAIQCFSAWKCSNCEYFLSIYVVCTYSKKKWATHVGKWHLEGHESGSNVFMKIEIFPRSVATRPQLITSSQMNIMR